MGKRKENAYQVFVRQEFNRMRREGMNPEMSSLFAKLGDKWTSMSEESKAYYKEKAANPNSNASNSFPRPQPPPPPHPQTPEPKPSTTNLFYTQPNDANVDVDKKFSPNLGIGVDCKPAIKQERGVKRDLDVEVYVGQQDEQSHKQPNKRWKDKSGLGKGFPNFKNITKDPACDSERYADFHLLRLRETCESIVAARANDLLTIPMYTISCNVLCKYYFEGKDGKETKYIPLEISIAPYTIESGQFKEPYHVIIDSDRPPVNFWGDTHDHMISTHKIKVGQFGGYPPEARKDYRNIYKEMQKYTYDGEKTVLVADIQDLEQVTKCIEWLHEMAEKQAKVDKQPKALPKPSTWTILPLVDFVAATYNFVHCNMLKYKLPKFTLHYYLKVRLESSIWDYELDLMCPYHKQYENQTKFCAKSCAVRVIKALQLTLEDIYEKFKTVEALAEKKRQQTSQEGVDSIVPKQTRTPAQQVQQPLHMPEEKEPPPVVEEIARREEWERNFLRQQQILADELD